MAAAKLGAMIDKHTNKALEGLLFGFGATCGYKVALWAINIVF